MLGVLSSVASSASSLGASIIGCMHEGYLPDYRETAPLTSSSPWPVTTLEVLPSDADVGSATYTAEIPLFQTTCLRGKMLHLSSYHRMPTGESLPRPPRYRFFERRASVSTYFASASSLRVSRNPPRGTVNELSPMCIAAPHPCTACLPICLRLRNPPTLSSTITSRVSLGRPR